ncbi:MAG: hypothetical protein RL033_313 [Pseudomonadota bacterium]
MKRTFSILVFLPWLGCSDGSTCQIADYSECGSPLGGIGSDGEPWPTWSQSLAEAQACPADVGSVLRGACADGKQFISTNGGFGGGTRYFRGEDLVGLTSYTDVGTGPCQCPFERFRGTLESVRCDTPVFEALCQTASPETFYAPFSQGIAECSCDDAGDH